MKDFFENLIFIEEVVNGLREQCSNQSQDTQKSFSVVFSLARCDSLNDTRREFFGGVEFDFFVGRVRAVRFLDHLGAHSARANDGHLHAVRGEFNADGIEETWRCRFVRPESAR